MSWIALVGDHNPAVVAHAAIPRALARARDALQRDFTWRWIGTDAVGDPAQSLAGAAGIWLVPASPYRSEAGALAAVRHAREQARPFLGTCGGFQHALLEFARHVLPLPGAEHAETAPTAPDLVVTRLACSLVEQSGAITFAPDSRLHQICGPHLREGYHCNYGPNPAYRAQFEAAGWHFSGCDEAGEIRAGELAGHPFFVGTLFQPERSALRDETHPLVVAFAAAATA